MIWFQVFLLTVCLEAFFIDDITVAMAFRVGLISEGILILGSEYVGNTFFGIFSFHKRNRHTKKNLAILQNFNL